WVVRPALDADPVERLAPDTLTPVGRPAQGRAVARGALLDPRDELRRGHPEGPVRARRAVAEAAPHAADERRVAPAPDALGQLGEPAAGRMVVRLDRLARRRGRREHEPARAPHGARGEVVLLDRAA